MVIVMACACFDIEFSALLGLVGLELHLDVKREGFLPKHVLFASSCATGMCLVPFCCLEVIGCSGGIFNVGSSCSASSQRLVFRLVV